MKVSINVFVFCICSPLAFCCGLDEDLTEIKQMMGKLIEENMAILRSEVESIRGQNGEENAILRSEVESIRGQYGEVLEENAILKREVENIRGQNGEKNAILREVESISGQCGEVFEENAILRSDVESIREENAILRSEVEAINLKLEGVQEGNNILLNPTMYQVLRNALSRCLSMIV